MKEIDPKLLKFGPFASTTINNKYSKFPSLQDKQTWVEIAKRVAYSVMGAVDAPKDLIEELAYRISIRQIIPGGRYLYAAGRDYHQTQNCLLMRAEDSREGWADTMYRASMALMSGAGIGIEYSPVRPEGRLIRRTGGESTGPTALMQMVNESGRHIMQGGSRRSAIWAGLGWDHEDIFKFIHLKDWSKEVRELKNKDFNFPATMDGTNVSVRLDDEFFKAYNDKEHSKHDLAKKVYWETIGQMLKTGEPGFSIDTGENSGETLRNACQPAWAKVITPNGIRCIGDINIGDTIWSGKQWTKITNKWSTGRKEVYRFGTTAGYFEGTDDHKVVSNGEKVEVRDAVTIDIVCNMSSGEIFVHDPQDVMDGLVFGDGYIHKASNNLPLLCIGEKDGDYHSSEVSNLIKKHREALSVHSWEIITTIPDAIKIRTYERDVPDEFYYGNANKVAGFLRGLFSANGSIAGDRVTLKATSFKVIEKVQDMLSFLGIHSYYTTNKSKEIEWSNGKYTSKESYDINITGKNRIVFYNTIGFIHQYKTDALVKLLDKRTMTKKVSYDIIDKEFLGIHEVFDITVDAEEHTYWTGGLLVSNCTEVTSHVDSDICNLLSINMARINSLEDMQTCVEISIAFLVAGTVYSHVPYEKVNTVREANRRLGLGLMGLHEWLLRNGKKYGPDEDLAKYLEIYERSTVYAHKWEQQWSLSKSVKTRAIAPTGTIAICAETTSGVEPLFCAAYKRRYLNKRNWEYQYVIDPIAKKLVESGINPDDIEDAYSLSEQPERRVEFQVWLQKYVDHGISSTLNLPTWGSEFNNEDKVKGFGNMLIKYLPQLRGITCYPDGARGGQPLNTVRYETAIKHEGQIFYEQGDICDIKGGGSCSS